MIDCYTTDPDLLHEALNAQDVEIEKLKQQLDAEYTLLKKLEWSKSYSYCTGWPICPICGGIKPGYGRDERGILPDNQGHKKGCGLANAIDKELGK